MLNKYSAPHGELAAKTLRKTARQIARKRKESTLEVSDFLATLKRTNTNEACCLVCGESMKNTLGTRHIDRDRRNSENSDKVKMCASCHRILGKAKSPIEARIALEERHRKFESRSS